MNSYELLNLLGSSEKKRIIIDTDAYNEVDDQFAIAYAMLSPDRIDLLSLNAAPFVNKRASTPLEGMSKSYDEIQKIMELTLPGSSGRIPSYKGSGQWMSSSGVPVESDACDNIIRTVMDSDEPVYIIALGALTNVSSAIIKEPGITEKSAVIWLGGHTLDWPHTREFNLWGDKIASQVLFDSNMPLLQIPCYGVCSAFTTTVPELKYYLGGKNPLCDYLVGSVDSYIGSAYAASKPIWDVTAVAAAVKPEALGCVVIPRPAVTSDGHWAFDGARTPYVYVRNIKRDIIYADLFRKLGNENITII